MSNSNLNRDAGAKSNLNLRDQFALRILPTIWDKGHRIEECESFSDVASIAYKMADLMMKAREGDLVYPGTEVITLEGEDGGHIEVRLDLNDKGRFDAYNEHGEDVELTEEEIQEVFEVSSFNDPGNESDEISLGEITSEEVQEVTDKITASYERDL